MLLCLEAQAQLFLAAFTWNLCKVWTGAQLQNSRCTDSGHSGKLLHTCNPAEQTNLMKPFSMSLVKASMRSVSFCSHAASCCSTCRSRSANAAGPRWEFLAEHSISRQSVVLLDSMACRSTYSFSSIALKGPTTLPATVLVSTWAHLLRLANWLSSF